MGLQVKWLWRGWICKLVNIYSRFGKTLAVQAFETGIQFIYSNVSLSYNMMMKQLSIKICPHRRCSGRDHPDGINNCKVQYRFTRGGVIFW